MQVRSKIAALVNAINLHHKYTLDDTIQAKEAKAEALKIINNTSKVLFTNILMFMQKEHRQKYKSLCLNDPGTYYSLLIHNGFDKDIQAKAIDLFTIECIKKPELLDLYLTTQAYVSKLNNVY